MKIISILIFLSFFTFTSSHANNLRISAPQIQSIGAEKALITFNLSWENSWKDAVNHDAVWIFIKYKKDNTWHHATLEAGDTNPSVVNVYGTPDKRGIFISRKESGEGNMNAEGLRINWNFMEDGADPLEQAELQIYGIEMVLVSEGAFYLNANPSPVLINEFVSVNGSLSNIDSENALEPGLIRWIMDNITGGTGNEIIIGFDSYAGSDSLEPDYPKGYAAFYIQKYETSHQQYIDFLNTLSRQAQNNRVNKNISSNFITDTLVMVNHEIARNRIFCSYGENDPSEPLIFYTDRPDRACNFLTWSHGAAYLDWAGLRPMSELEYEKACRGPLNVIDEEYSWGSNIIEEAFTISSEENGEEFITESNVNCNFNYILDNILFTGGDEGFGPLRVGIFATPVSGRQQSGASYYGAMEMSGNVWERCVTVAYMNEIGEITNAGKFSRFIHGDGMLDDDGKSNVDFWPGDDAIGSNFRGGNWYRIKEYAMVSHRLYAGLTDNAITSHRGIRGVRTVTWEESEGTGFSAAKYKGGSFDGYEMQSVNNIINGTVLNTSSEKFNIYPNPAKGNINIESYTAVDRVEIQDLSGRIIKVIKLNPAGYSSQVSVEDIHPGFYIVFIYGKDLFKKGKITIQR